MWFDPYSVSRAELQIPISKTQISGKSQIQSSITMDERSSVLLVLVLMEPGRPRPTSEAAPGRAVSIFVLPDDTNNQIEGRLSPVMIRAIRGQGCLGFGIWVLGFGACCVRQRPWPKIIEKD